MDEESTYKHITTLFYDGEYDQGKKQLMQLIDTYPENSSLLSNKALYETQLGNDSQAQQDLKKSILINPLNYIAYFNLFSIQVRNSQDIEAFENLCCSLSCLNLMKAKNTKNLSDVQKSIAYAHNNVEAHVLKSLILTNDSNHQTALEAIQTAIAYEPSNKILRKVQSSICEKTNPEKSENFTQIVDSQKLQKFTRLKSSFKLNEQPDIVSEINQKIDEFNELYTFINSQAVTQKVPKGSHISQNHEKEQRVTKKYSRDRDSEVVIIEDKGVATPEKPDSDPMAEGKMSHIEEFQQFQSVLYSQKKESKVQQNFVDQGTREEQEQTSQEQLNLLYPRDQQSKLSPTILQLSFLKQDNLERMTSIYCIVSYNNSKFKTNTIKCTQEGLCQWNQKFDPVQITPQPSQMRIKVYNKVYNAIRDELIGTIEVLITTADKMKLPLYDKKGEISAELLLDLYLIESTTEQLKNQK